MGGRQSSGGGAPRRGSRLLAVGLMLIVLGAAVLFASVMKGWGAGFGAVPGLAIVILGAVFVLISADIYHVDVTVGQKQAGLHVGSSSVEPPSDVSEQLAPIVPDERTGSIARSGEQRRHRHCRLIKRKHP
jgi:hypothetical protein